MRGLKTKQTIASSFIVIVLIILVIGQGSLWIWFLFTQKSHNQRILDDKVKTAANLLTDVSAAAMMYRDYKSLGHYVEDVLKDEDVLSVKVMDNEKKILVENTNGMEQGKRRVNPFFVPWTNRLNLPITSDGQEIGSIEIIYSGSKVNEAMRSLLIVPPLMQLLVFLVVIRAIYYFFQRKIGKPMRIIQDRIESVTAGDLTVQIPETGEGEIGVIANGLKFLIERLSLNISGLNAAADNVAVAIGQLNVTFANVSSIIKRQSDSMDQIALSLRRANESQRQIGDSTVELSDASTENASILLQVKSTADEIVSNSNKLFQASDDSYSIVAEMAQTSKVMAEHAQSVLSSVEGTLASVEVIMGSVGEVEKGARDSSILAENVREITAEKGIITVSDAVEGMNKISENVKYSADVVRRLGARSKDVEKMLSVIREVTEQTNLLSLNAAILAQEAGEYGKGFSVVADEMRALSDRTAASTKETAGIVKTIQAEITNAVESIEAGTEMVQKGNALVYKVGEAMGSVLEAAQNSANMTTAIQKKTEQQARGLNQITVSMKTISKMASRMSGAMDEQLKGSGYMLERVGEVKEIAEITKKGTEEQAERTDIMTKNLELANVKMARINHAALNQQSVNDEIILAVEDIRNTSIGTLKDVEAVSLSLKALQEEMNMLKKEMEIFKVS